MARTYGMLVACALIVCLPSGALHVNLCDCNGLLVETHADPCPCEQPAPPSECESSCCGRDSRAGEPGDEPGDSEHSCCADLSLDYLHLVRDGPAKASIEDVEPESGFDMVARLADVSPVRLRAVRATGPPGRHETRRRLVERASVVLLI